MLAGKVPALRVWLRLGNTIRVLDNIVTVAVGSKRYGAGSFPFLAGDDDDAGDRSTVVCAIAT